MRNKLSIFCEVTFRFGNKIIKSLVITFLGKKFSSGPVISFFHKPMIESKLSEHGALTTKTMKSKKNINYGDIYKKNVIP